MALEQYCTKQESKKARNNDDLCPCPLWPFCSLVGMEWDCARADRPEGRHSRGLNDHQLCQVCDTWLLCTILALMLAALPGSNAVIFGMNAMKMCFCRWNLLTIIIFFSPHSPRVNYFICTVLQCNLPPHCWWGPAPPRADIRTWDGPSRDRDTNHHTTFLCCRCGGLVINN